MEFNITHNDLAEIGYFFLDEGDEKIILNMLNDEMALRIDDTSRTESVNSIKKDILFRLKNNRRNILFKDQKTLEFRKR